MTADNWITTAATVPHRTEAQQSILASYRKQRRLGHRPLIAAFNVHDDLARTIADGCLYGELPSPQLRHEYRAARAMVAQIAVRETARFEASALVRTLRSANRAAS